MNRIINVNVGGNYISKDNKNAGVKGEANVTSLRITFDESWDGYAKKVVFIDAHGKNPVSVVLGVNLLEDIHVANVYLVSIPAEPLAEGGTMTFIIEGTVENKVQKSFADTLEVKYAPTTDSATEPVEPTPTELEQIQAEIEAILDEIKGAYEAKEDIENMSVSAEMLEDVIATVTKTERDGVVNLHFGIPRGKKGERGLSGVHIGNEAPTDPDISVWIDTSGEGTIMSGKSAYEVAVDNGFEGSEAEWLDSLKYVLTQEDEEDIAEILKSEGISLQNEEEELISVTLRASMWEGTTAPYTQTVSVDGITADTDGTVFVPESATDEQYNAALYANLRKTAQENGSITVKAYGEKPTVDIPLTVKVGG